jgi:hypothetical protein
LRRRQGGEDSKCSSLHFYSVFLQGKGGYDKEGLARFFGGINERILPGFYVTGPVKEGHFLKSPTISPFMSQPVVSIYTYQKKSFQMPEFVKVDHKK